jgi:hypothetical protein
MAKFSWIFFQLLGCALFFNWSCPVQAANLANPDLKKIKQIIHLGSLAPSTHNAQMWKVKIIAEDKIRILLDREHILPQVDPQNRESMISLGAFIENMVESAPYHGLQVEVRLLTGSPFEPGIAELTFRPKHDLSLANAGLLADIQNRHTIRIPYLHRELRDQDMKWIKAFGTELHFFAVSSQEGQYIQKAVIQATKQQVANDNKQRELAGLFHFSKQEAAKAKDGITPDGMGLSGIAKWFVTTFFTHKTVMSKSFREQTVATTKKQVENCSGFVLLTAADNSVTSWVESGRTLEKFLIMATGKQLAVQPMSAPLEEGPWNEEFAQKIGLEKTVQMILRVGYVKDYGHPVSMRRKVLIVE